MAINFTPDDVASGFNLSKLNSNFDKVETALSDALSRSGNGPNQMEADIDLNSNDLLNVGVVNAGALVLNGEVVTPDELQTVPSTVMLKSVYDPQLKLSDVYLASNHDVTVGVTERTVSDKLSEIPSIKDYGAIGNGVANDSAAILAAVTAKTHVRVPAGSYLINTNLTIPSSCTVEFDKGAVFSIGTSITVTWNGGIKAGPKQRIFSGNLVQSSFTTNSLTPYVLALQGTPKIEWSSPWWFGAVGDNVTDDYNAFVCSFFFGPGSYVPAIDVASGNRYLCTTSIPVRRSMFIKGDGYGSWMRLVSFTPSGVGQFIGISGLLPTVSGGQPAAFVDNVVIDGIHIDTNNGINDNGIGGSFCRNVEIKSCFFSNVGRKAVTWQYHVHNHHVHDCTIFSASTESGGTQSVLTTEGENSSFSYANGVAGFDHNGNDNTANTFRDIHIYQSGYSGITISNARRTLVENVTIDSLGLLGRPVIVGRVSKDNTFRGVKVKTSTRGFLIVTSSTVISTKFEDCWVEDCSGDNMFYSEGPGTEFFNCGGTQTDDRTAWSIRGADCKITHCRVNFTALTSATQATALFSTAARFVMENCYIDSSTGLRGFGSSTASDVKVIGNTITGGVTDGINIGSPNFVCVNNIIGGNSTNRVVTSATAINGVCTGNVLTGGASAQINFNNTSLFSSVKCNNPGDTNTGDNLFLGVSTLWVDATGDLRVLTSGVRTGDLDGVVVGTQT